MILVFIPLFGTHLILGQSFPYQLFIGIFFRDLSKATGVLHRLAYKVILIAHLSDKPCC